MFLQCMCSLEELGMVHETNHSVHLHVYMYNYCHTDFLVQELNSKAESKFNKLKAQAKTKIANLNRELEKLRTEKGVDTSFNVSAIVSSVSTCMLYTRSGSSAHWYPGSRTFQRTCAIMTSYQSTLLNQLTVQVTR